MAVITEEPNNGKVTIVLSVDEQRKVSEHHVGEPCFRMRLTATEYHAAKKTTPDFTYSALSDGTFAVWRRQSDLTKLRQMGGEHARLADFIESRIIDDAVT